MSLFGSIVKTGSLGLIDPDKKAPSSPNLPAAPEWKDSMIYDDEGRLAGSITKDANGNIVYKPRELTGEELTNKKAIESTKQTVLQRLYDTPEEYTRAAQEEADAWAKLQNEATQKQFKEDINKIGETSNIRGLYGSKAMADIVKSREETQAKTSADIAGNALSMRENLIEAKKAQDYNLYNLYGSALNDYSTKNMQNLQMAQGLSSNINQFNQSNWATTTNALIANYQNKLAEYQANDPWRNYVAPLLQTGVQLIGQKQSDRRLKKNIIPIFKVGDVQFYEFEYNPEVWPEGVVMPQPGKHIGVMADEVRGIPGAVDPEAFYGYDMVNYEVIRRHLGMENA